MTRAEWAMGSALGFYRMHQRYPDHLRMGVTFMQRLVGEAEALFEFNIGADANGGIVRLRTFAGFPVVVVEDSICHSCEARPQEVV